MKLGDNGASPVERGGTDSTPQAFRIAASKEAFKILSDGLYNNKIGAIIRELSCNAYDSHVAAGKKDVPFEVHLPTMFELFFKVTDFGVGLSEEEVYNLYTTYFGTNKSDSNDFIGALGLGSKSPFCYTEGFTVVSRFNGKKMIFSCYVNEFGPTVEKQLEEDTTESNGLEVSFPVNRNDCNEFENNAEKVYEFFEPKPLLNKTITIKTRTYLLKTERWGIRKSEDYLGVRAIQGMVPYSIGTIDKSRLDYEEQKLLQIPLDIFFPIGELSVAASRETLSNDEKTITNIINAIKGIADKYVEAVKKQIDEIKTAWEAMIFVNEKLHGGHEELAGLVERAFRAGKFDGTYTAIKIDKNIGKVLKIHQFDHLNVTLNRFSPGYTSKADADKTRIWEDYDIRNKRVCDIKAENRARYETRIQPNSRTLFVIGDVPFGAEKFIHYLLKHDRTSNYKEVYLISRAHKDVSVKDVNFEALSIINKLGNPPSIYLSSLRDKYLPEMRKETQPASKRDIVYFDTHAELSRYGEGYERKAWGVAWKPCIYDYSLKKYMYSTTDKKFYLKLLRGVPTALEFDFADELRDLLKAISDASRFDFDYYRGKVFGVSETSQVFKEIEKDPTWVEFSKHVFDLLLQIMTPELEAKLSLQVQGFKASLEGAFPQFREQLASTSPMYQFCKDLAEARSIDIDKAEALAKVITAASKHNKYNMKKQRVFSEDWSNLLNRYPMLKQFRFDGHALSMSKQDQINSMVEYIQLIDEKRGKEELRQQQEAVKLLLEGDVQLIGAEIKGDEHEQENQTAPAYNQGEQTEPQQELCASNSF